MPEHTSGAEVFQHLQNITIGSGRILYGRACTDSAGIFHAEGWTLPGGARTQSQVEAHGAAMRLNVLLGGTA